MAVPQRVLEAKGRWKGKSQLHHSFLPPDQQVTESASEIWIDTDAHGAFATIAYTWEHEGTPQSGRMLLAMDGESKSVQIGWVDSWHQSSGVMHLAGTEMESGGVKTDGSYAAGEETWGWTIALEVIDDELILTMENVVAGEKPEWAVRGVYRRV